MRVPLLILLHVSPLLVSAAPKACDQSSLSPFRRFTNSIISSIWPLQHAQSKSPANADCAKPRDTPAAVNLHSEDVVLRFNLSSAAQAQAIAEAADEFYLDIWEYSDDWVDIRVAQSFVPSLLDVLPSSLQSSWAPLIPESTLKQLVQSSVSSHHSFSPSLRASSRSLFFSDYQPLSVIYPWLKFLTNMFSTHAKIVHIGQSYEDREILGIRLGRQADDGDEPSKSRKTILITGGSHAREWISISSVNYLIYNMATLYGKSEPYTAFMDEFDWVFVPVLNPDGYDYSWNSDRLWRKNRQPGQWKFCRGIDLDRNWGYQFGAGQVGNPCSESFPGQDAWEAVETSRMREWVRNQTETGTEFVAYLDFHSYSQMILYPYSYSCESSPPTLENLEELALGLAKAMRVHGATYRTAAACEGNVAANSRAVRAQFPFELGGGSALDWFYQAIKVKYAFQLKLRDTGSYGFLLPKEHIVPTGKEVLSAITYLGRFLRGEIGLLNEENLPNTNEAIESTTVPASVPQADDQNASRKSRMWPTKLDFRRRR